MSSVRSRSPAPKSLEASVCYGDLPLNSRSPALSGAVLLAAQRGLSLRRLPALSDRTVHRPHVAGTYVSKAGLRDVQNDAGSVNEGRYRVIEVGFHRPQRRGFKSAS